LIRQFALVKQVGAAAYAITWIECRGYEAKDAIATLAQQTLRIQGLTVDIIL
jgi:5'-3' exonuclease